MRSKLSDIIEKGRVTLAQDQVYGSEPRNAPNGCYLIHPGPFGTALKIIAHEGEGRKGYEHVSVSCQGRVPSWEEMCWVKDQFWYPTEYALQIHPPAKDYVNFHPFCLHLWRPCDNHFRMPPSILVGPK
jgi:hypothetical protein